MLKASISQTVPAPMPLTAAGENDTNTEKHR